MSAHRIEGDAEPIRYELPGFRWTPFSVPGAGVNYRHLAPLPMAERWLLEASGCSLSDSGTSDY